MSKFKIHKIVSKLELIVWIIIWALIVALWFYVIIPGPIV